jgi:hypothetical protein
VLLPEVAGKANLAARGKGEMLKNAPRRGHRLLVFRMIAIHSDVRCRTSRR